MAAVLAAEVLVAAVLPLAFPVAVEFVVCCFLAAPLAVGLALLSGVFFVDVPVLGLVAAVVLLFPPPPVEDVTPTGHWPLTIVFPHFLS